MRIDGVVILYNPQGEILTHIESYINHLTLLYVIDNSIIKNNLVINGIRKISNVFYCDNHGNQGIASALNIAINFAKKNNADWLLTMDQDSFFDQDNLKKLINSIEHVDIQKTGIISPAHLI